MVISVSIDIVSVIFGIGTYPIMKRSRFLYIAHGIVSNFICNTFDIGFYIFVDKSHILCAVEVFQDEILVLAVEIPCFAVKGRFGVDIHQVKAIAERSR